MASCKKQMSFLILSLISLSDTLDKRSSTLRIMWAQHITLLNIPPNAAVNPFVIAGAPSATKIVGQNSVSNSSLLTPFCIS